MNAQEAYQVAFKGQFAAMDYIYERIRKAAQDKRFEVTIPFILIKHLRERLIKEGYQVNIVDRYDGMTIIGWWLGDIADPVTQSSWPEQASASDPKKDTE